jgi:uncharacterized membrane protein YgdD (TMEM256/DUF423 family)
MALPPLSNPSQRIWVTAGALNGLSAVALAAVAAHAGLADDRLIALKSGIEIQGWHAAALLYCSLRSGRLIAAAALAFLLGTLLFCAGVYAVAFAGQHLGPVAPTGGIMLMLGWVLLLASAISKPPSAR